MASIISLLRASFGSFFVDISCLELVRFVYRGVLWDTIDVIFKPTGKPMSLRIFWNTEALERLRSRGEGQHLLIKEMDLALRGSFSHVLQPVMIVTPESLERVREACFAIVTERITPYTPAPFAPGAATNFALLEDVNVLALACASLAKGSIVPDLHEEFLVRTESGALMLDFPFSLLGRPRLPRVMYPVMGAAAFNPSAPQSNVEAEAILQLSWHVLVRLTGRAPFNGNYAQEIATIGQWTSPLLLETIKMLCCLPAETPRELMELLFRSIVEVPSRHRTLRQWLTVFNTWATPLLMATRQVGAGAAGVFDSGAAGAGAGAAAAGAGAGAGAGSHGPVLTYKTVTALYQPGTGASGAESGSARGGVKQQTVLSRRLRIAPEVRVMMCLYMEQDCPHASSR